MDTSLFQFTGMDKKFTKEYKTRDTILYPRAVVTKGKKKEFYMHNPKDDRGNQE